MREIKFRIRNTTTEEIIGYECLFPVDTKNSKYEWAGSVNGQDWGSGTFRPSDLYIYDREQYTGVKDKNSLEIYEADIVRTKVSIYKVKYERGSYLLFPLEYKYLPGSEYFIYLSGLPAADIEVVGDIYHDREELK